MTKLTVSLILILAAPAFGANRTTEKIKCTGNEGISFEIEKPLSDGFAEATADLGELRNFTAPKRENGKIVPNQFITVKSAKLDILNNNMATQKEPSVVVAGIPHSNGDSIAGRMTGEFSIYLLYSGQAVAISCQSELASSKNEKVDLLGISMDAKSYQFKVRKSKITVISSTSNSVTSKTDFVDEVFEIPESRKMPSLHREFLGYKAAEQSPMPLHEIYQKAKPEPIRGSY